MDLMESNYDENQFDNEFKGKEIDPFEQRSREGTIHESDDEFIDDSFPEEENSRNFPSPRLDARNI